MAHFHKFQNDERISGQRISVTNTSITIGLWGYLDFNQRELTVVSNNRGVTATPKRIVGNSREWQITSTVCGSARLEARTVDGGVWDSVDLAFMAPSAHTAEQRHAVIIEAQRHVGAHYVWGAAGATPGGLEGMPARPGSVSVVTDRLDAGNPCLRAASCSVDGYHVCAGRYRTAAGRVFQPADAALTTYLDSLRGMNPEQWPPMEGFWPRMMEGRTVTKQIVLGESCLRVRHFDCIGFINYCLSVALRRSVQDSIQGFIRNTQEVWINTNSNTSISSNDQPGDIVTIGTHHIGFSMGDGRAIHASETARGVVIDSLAGGSWSRRGRYLH